MSKENVIVVDANCLCYMSKFAFGKLSYHEKQTGIIFGFLGQIFRLAKEFDTNQFVFAWDSRKSYRKQKDASYKRNRRKDRTEEEIQDDKLAYSQFGDLRISVLPWLGFHNNFIQVGHEADDIIASVVTSTDKYRFFVVSTDNDLLQLLDHCILYNPLKKTQTTKLRFTKQWDLEPKQWAEVKSLAGCASDNVKGVHGVGEKTAAKYIRGKLTKGKVYNRIITQKSQELINYNRWFVLLPLDTTKQYKIDFNKEVFRMDSFIEVFTEFGLQSFLKKDKFVVWKRRFELQ